MKKTSGNICKYLCLVVMALLCALPCLAYETVILKFPDNMGWRKVHYVGGKKEAIVQYAPRGHTREHFTETVVYHSYKSKKATPEFARQLMYRQLGEVRQTAKNLTVEPLRVNSKDTMFYWCATNVGTGGGQCEIVRSTPTHEGVIMIHYINKDINDFKYKKDEWAERVRKAKTYYSYYRTDFILNKEIFFEL